MVWGMSGDGKSFGKVLNDTDSLTLDLPNGDWKFYAMAWDTSTSIPMSTATGAARCAQSLPIKLDGAPQAPALVMTVTNCNDVMFKGTLSGSIASTMLRLRACESVDGILADSDACTNDRTDINRKSDKAPVMSARIRLADYGNGVGVAPGEGLSRCIQMTNGVSGQWMTPGPGTLFIPSGDPTRPAAVPFRVEIEFFYNSLACADANPSKIVLPNSFVSTTPGKKHFFSGTSEFVLSIAVPDSMVCGNGRNTATPFAGGDGTDNFPYLICSAPQLHQLINSGTYLANSFRLSADINLNNFAKNIAADADLPTDADCWGPGQTWQPIGLTYGVYPTCTITSAGTVTGNFDGNNHKITGMRMRMESAASVGFIGTWSPTMDETFIRDLQFENVEISAGMEIGTVVGYKGGSNIVVISNIKVRDAKIEVRGSGAGDSGGIIGQGDRVDLIDLQVLESTIETRAGSVGGIFGMLSNSRRVQNLHSRVDILPSYLDANVGGIGGVGSSFSSNELVVDGWQNWSHEGILVATAPGVGGLLGNVGSTFNPGPVVRHFNNFYANSAITALGTTPNNVGGIFGTSQHDGQVNNGYFAGHIIDKCTSACIRGKVIGSSVTPPSSLTGVRVIADNLPAPAGNGDNGGTLFGSVIELVDNALYALNATVYDSAPFIHRAGDLPRFVSEQHPCSADAVSGVSSRDALSVQASVRGSASNPITICRKEQLEQLNSLTGVRNVKILSGISLRTPYTRPSIASGITVDGQSGFIFGYQTSGAGGVGEVRSPLNQNNGVIQNLKVANLQNEMTTGGPGSAIAGILQHNAGTVRNSSVLSGSLIASSITGTPTVSGIAVTNANGARLQGVRYSANIHGRGHISGIVNSNSGEISNSKFDGKISFNSGTGGYIHGVAKTNTSTGLITRMTVEGSIFDGGNNADVVSFFVDTNAGTISDSEVGSSARWMFPLILGMNTIASSNSGVIRRVLVGGLMLNTENMAAITDNFVGKPVTVNTGTVEGVITTYPSGRHIGNTSGTSITCSAADRFTISTGMPGAGAFQPGATYWTSFVGSAQMVWVVVEEDGDLRMARIINVITPTGTMDFQIDRPCAELNMAGVSMANVRIIQDYATAIAVAGGSTNTSPYNGVLYGQDNSLVGSGLYVGPWAGQFYEPESVPADMDTLIAHFTALLSGQNSTLARAWEYSDEWGMELVNKN